MIKEKIKKIIEKYPYLYLSQIYIKKRHRIPNFKNPGDLSEIVMSEALYNNLGQYAPYADKVKVREYIEEWGLGEYLPKIYGVWDNVDDINLDVLPNKFALKTNHGCGNHIFCHDKNTFDLEDAKKKIKPVLKEKYGSFLEAHYSLIPPKVYAEELLEQEGTKQPVDYKMMCCDGEVRFVFCAINRGTETGTRFIAYDLEWNRLDYIIGPEKTDEDLSAPSKESLSKMIDIAKIIAKHFVHVRVDLYDIDGKIYIGELTFTPEAGVMSYFNNKAVKAAGHLK